MKYIILILFTFNIYAQQEVPEKYWIEDNNFDWTAPLWGTLTGAAFGQVAWLKPKGKASSWKKDFMAGVGSVFSKTGQFQKMSRENLIGHASLYGQLSKRNGGSSIVSHTFRNKKANINLSSRNFFDDVEAVWGKDAEKAMREGNNLKVIQAKKAELLHNQLAREAAIIQKQFIKAEKDFKKFFKDSDKKVGQKKSRTIEFVNAGQEILSRFGLGPELEAGATFVDKLKNLPY